MKQGFKIIAVALLTVCGITSLVLSLAAVSVSDWSKATYFLGLWFFFRFLTEKTVYPGG
jgi:hypothetical protein